MNEQGLLPLEPDAPPDLRNDVMDPANLAFSRSLRPSSALVSSVQRWGVLQPVLVHMVLNDERQPEFRVIDGARRSWAAEINGIHVPCMMTANLRFLQSVAAVMLNATRSRNVVAESEAIDDLLAKGYTAKDIATKTGMPFGTVQKRMKLAKIIPGIMEAAKDGRIATGVLEKIAALTPSQQEKLLDIGTGEITAGDVKSVKSLAAQQFALDLPADLYDVPEVGNDSGPHTDPEERLRAIVEALVGHMKEHGFKVKAVEAMMRRVAKEANRNGGD